jgi:hypothetical protein
MAQVRAACCRPLLPVSDRQLPMLPARGGHGRRGPTALQRGGDGHKLNRRVRPVHDDHLPRWQVAEGDTAVGQRLGGLHQIELVPFGVQHGDPVLAVFLDGTQLGRPDLA